MWLVLKSSGNPAASKEKELGVVLPKTGSLSSLPSCKRMDPGAAVLRAVHAANAAAVTAAALSAAAGAHPPKWPPVFPAVTEPEPSMHDSASNSTGAGTGVGTLGTPGSLFKRALPIVLQTTRRGQRCHCRGRRGLAVAHA